MRFGYWRYLTVLSAALLALGAGPAWAQTITPVLLASPDIGNVIPGNSGTTNFSFASATGNVTQSGGSAMRKSTGQTRAQIRLDCVGTSTECAKVIYVTVGSIGTPTGRAGSLSNFNVSASSGTIGNTSGSTNPRTFRITPVNGSTRATFYLGARMPIGPTGTSGPATSGFFVNAGPAANPVNGVQGAALANALPGISVSGTPLNFGYIVRPSSGTKQVKIDPVLNQRTVGGVVTPGTFSRATFTVSGENGLAITVNSTPTTMNMSRSGGGSLSVTLLRSPLPTHIGTIGSPGTATFYIGGQFDVRSNTRTGTYTGSYNTTVSYN